MLRFLDSIVMLLTIDVAARVVLFSFKFGPFLGSYDAVRLCFCFIDFDFSLLGIKPRRFTPGELAAFDSLVDTFFLILFSLIDYWCFVLSIGAAERCAENCRADENC